MPSFLPKVTRLGFSVAQALSPRLAGKLAFKLFCLTPGRRPKGERAKKIHTMGQERLREAETFDLVIPGGARAAAYRLNGGAKGRRKRYLVVHGWGSGSAYMSELIAALAGDGSEVVALDFPGHGSASGRFLHMGMAVKAIAAAEARFGAFDAAIGHSFGGAALMVSAAGLLPDVAQVLPGKLVLIGAPSRMRWLFVGLGKLLGLGAAAQAHFEAEILRVTGRRLEDFDMAHAGGCIRRPVLVVHAEEDKEVSADHAWAYATGGDHVRLLWANGFGHRRIIAAHDVIAAISDFLKQEPERPDGMMKIVPLFGLPGRRMSL
ncbi:MULTISPECIES: alpha/beta hydrolase [unclassified Sinorhizobium]|uniref:alpha/beta hydrolase n=1 Tax=unclassified Sinorhizobium TaxID=2613772 RepID=UPI003523B74E